MLAFVLRRLMQAVIVMLTVAFLAFMLFQHVGDPVTSLLGQDATQEQRDQLRQDLGLDQPFPVQFAKFVGNAVQGEFGLSLRQGRKVSALIAERFPATLELALVAAVIALLVGIPLLALLLAIIGYCLTDWAWRVGVLWQWRRRKLTHLNKKAPP